MKLYISEATSPEVEQNIKKDIWRLVNKYDYVNNSDSDEFFAEQKYAEYKSTFSSIKKRILNKEVWYD